MELSCLRCVHRLLQPFQEEGCLAAVELGMVELQGNSQLGSEPAPSVSAPGEEGVVVDARVLVDDAVQLRAHHGRRPYNHGFVVVDVPARRGRFLRQPVVVAAELLDVGRVGDIAVADATLHVVHDHVDGQAVEAEQLAVLRQQVAFRHLAGGLADAPAQEHIEFQFLPTAQAAQAGRVKGLDERHHRHRRFHPQFKSPCPASFVGVDFLFHCCSVESFCLPLCKCSAYSLFNTKFCNKNVISVVFFNIYSSP